ncbi:MAG: CotH kinase family protein [Clostridium sp.]|nr:CotH kinase family protein [Clostridium sp.]
MRKTYVCLLLNLLTLAAQAAPQFKQNEAYRITCLEYNGGGIAPGSLHGSSYALLYTTDNNASKDMFWYIRSTTGGNYTICNAYTGQYVTYTGNYTSSERYVGLTSYKQDTDSEWMISYDENLKCYLISRPGNPNDVFNVRSSGMVGTYTESSGFTGNEMFTFYDTNGEEVTDNTAAQSATPTDYLSSFHINGNSPVYETGNREYLHTVPTAWIAENKGQAIVNFTWREADNYSLWIDNKQVANGNTVTFSRITTQTEGYLLQIKQGDAIVCETHIQLTQLPIVEINGSFYTSYLPGSIRVTEANGQEAPLYNARLKWRGATALSKHKKSYAVKLQDENGESQDVSFLGLRSDNNWILDAMAIDPSRMRNRVSTDLWNDYATAPYYKAKEPSALTGTRGQFVEVLLNGVYNGLYCMTEKIDRKQLKLKKYDGTSTTLNTIRGVLYKSKDWSYEIFMGHESGSKIYPRRAPKKYYNDTESWQGWEHKYPDITDGEDIDWTPLYNAINMVATSSDDEFRATVADYFDLPVMMDYYLLIELMKATDNHGKNLYLAIHNINTDTKLTVIPWDMDGTWGRRWDGSTDYCNPEEDFISFLWAHEHGEHTLYKRLAELNPDGWNEALALRYARLRLGAFNEDSLIARFETYKNDFVDGGAARREIARWNDYDSKDMDFESEQEYIADWINRRLMFLDQQYDIENIETGIKESENASQLILTAGRGKILIKTSKPLQAPLYNVNGQMMRMLDIPVGYTEVNDLPAGIYLFCGKKIAILGNS